MVLIGALNLLFVWALNLTLKNPSFSADLSTDQQNLLHWVNVLGRGAEWGLTVITAVLSAISLPAAQGPVKFALFIALALSALNLSALLYSGYLALT